MSADDLRLTLRGKRIAAFDFGMTRIGWAVCDERHIIISPRGVFTRGSSRLWDDITGALSRENTDICLVGVPLRAGTQENALLQAIHDFKHELSVRSSLPVYEIDEAFSSRRAVQTMIEIGVPKMKRRSRERKDEIAAAIMLRDFLKEFE